MKLHVGTFNEYLDWGNADRMVTYISSDGFQRQEENKEYKTISLIYVVATLA